MIRGIRLRLALALLAVVTGALGVAYLIVVPTLENRLVDATLDDLEQDARTVQNCLEVLEFNLWQQCADNGPAILNVRVVVYEVLRRDPPSLQIVADSQGGSSQDVERDPVAGEAASSARTQRGTATRGPARFAEVAVPLASNGPVVLLASPLSDQLESIAVVERRFIIGGALALLVAGLIGYALASLHAGRIRRLERAADGIASGRFDEPVVDDGNDELGELAAAFERMRLRLDNLDRARREFIANASHELRTPLFSLGGFLELMTDEELDEGTRREFVGTMREQVDRLAKLATDLLDLSRLDAGRMRVQLGPVDLAEVARLLGEEFGVLAELRGHALRVEVDGEPLAYGDELRVLQIGRALVDNALVHTPAGTSVVVRASSAAHRSLLSVSDDGPGIAAEDVDSVFDRFYRVEGDVASGSGLGLAIARELASLMGGEVTLASRPGRTTVSVTLPAPVPEREPAAVST
ncbi:MAG: HAMP domain-containing histidine kinase [Actinobacteria bacterium]|nr:HAMP domain-containing histidine kinase [Actinomycetota bacterium]